MTADEPVVVGKIVPGVGERKAVDSLTVRVDGSRVITLAPSDPYVPRHVAFDGRRFVVGHGMWGRAAEDLYHMTRLDLAHRARRRRSAGTGTSDRGRRVPAGGGW